MYRLRTLVRTSTPAQRGALAAVFLVVIVLATLTARQSSMGLGAIGDALVGLGLVTLLAAVLGAAAHAAVWLVRRIPSFAAAGLTGLTIAGVSLLAILLPTPITGTYVLVILAAAAWTGAAVGAVLGLRSGTPSRLKRVLVLGQAGLVAGLAVAAGFTWLAGSAGSGGFLGDPPAQDATLSGGGESDPGARGSFEVRHFTYGSGSDRRRQQYRGDVTLRSPTVDLAPLTVGFDAWRAGLHETYWGFPLTRAPLNARVWAPDAPGRFPVVIVVHGNRHTDQPAEDGYGYLGELLASRGNVVVAIDQNFLNGPWLAAERREMPARAWLVLRHLQQLKEWDARTGTPFTGRLDLDRIALIGHSRGGEAVMLAAALNGLERFPDDATIPLGFDFRIRGVVALAPTDQMYRMVGRPVALYGVSYLVLHGSQDGDVFSFLGTGQYQRVSLEPGSDQFKAAIYIHGANHSQFNELWEGGDSRFPLDWLLNRNLLLDAAVQRRIVSVYASAFIEDVLHDDDRYRPIFREARLAGAWLPKTRYVSRYQEGSTRLVATYEEDIDPTTLTVAGGSGTGTGLLMWREMALYLRDRRATPQQNTAVGLVWRRESGRNAPVYEITMPDSVAAHWTSGGGASLVLSVANATPSGEAVDMTIEVESANGQRARLPLSSIGGLVPRVHTPVWSPTIIDRYMIRGPEQILQSYRVPLAELARINPRFDPLHIRAVRLHFDRTHTGAILLDDVGFQLR